MKCQLCMGNNTHFWQLKCEELFLNTYIWSCMYTFLNMINSELYIFLRMSPEYDGFRVIYIFLRMSPEYDRFRVIYLDVFLRMTSPEYDRFRLIYIYFSECLLNMIDSSLASTESIFPVIISMKSLGLSARDYRNINILNIVYYVI